MTHHRNNVTTLTKKELALTVASRCNITYNTARRAVNEAIAEMAAQLSTPGNRIEFRGFGILHSCIASPRRTVNRLAPGGFIDVPARNRVRWRQSPLLRLEHTSGTTMPCPSGGACNPGQ